MYLAHRLDDAGKPAWIGLMVLAFALCWPVGLAILAFLIWSGRMSCWRHEGAHEWGSPEWRARVGERIAERMAKRQERWARRCGPRTSGNRAFDEYRAETIRRLEKEEREFREFLDRLRFAKDKVEFDEFLAQRRNQPETPPPPQA